MLEGDYDLVELRELIARVGGVHWGRQRTAPRRRDDADADRRAASERRCLSVRGRGAIRAGSPKRLTPDHCPAARAISGTARREISAA